MMAHKPNTDAVDDPSEELDPRIELSPENIAKNHAERQILQDSLPIYNLYDKPGETLGLAKKGCEFCDIVVDDTVTARKLVYEDEHCAMFLDLVQRAEAYYQCIPKRHIRDIKHLRPRIINGKVEPVEDLYADKRLIEHMHRVAQDFMQRTHPDVKEGYRFGFHAPPSNSKYHLHLHCIALPLKTKRWDLIYGELLTTVPDVLQMLDDAISQVNSEVKSRGKL